MEHTKSTDAQPATDTLAPPRRRRSRQRGAEAVEAAIGLLVVLPFMFLIADIGWGIFIKVTLQHAVREGVRYAITQQSFGGTQGQVASIKSTVKAQTGGLLNGQEEKILVRFYAPDGGTLLTGSNANRGGNVVLVSIENYNYYPIIPVPKVGSLQELEIAATPPIVMTVHAADRMEACPTSGCPTM